MGAVTTLDDLAVRAAALASDPVRPALLGLVGPPGAGKSTVGEHLAAALTARGVAVVRVPMDGFHLADAELVRLGRRDRKGAIDTFDAAGYASVLARTRTETDGTVYAPDFDRTVEQPIAGSIPVPPGTRLVLTEGNYLLDPHPAWRAVRALLDEVWYCDLDDEVRRARLVERHVRFGKAPDAARAWVATVDEPNAARIAAGRDAADLVVDVLALALRPGRD